jgi:hypothetical protein
VLMVPNLLLGSFRLLLVPGRQVFML